MSDPFANLGVSVTGSGHGHGQAQQQSQQQQFSAQHNFNQSQLRQTPPNVLGFASQLPSAAPGSGIGTSSSSHNQRDPFQQQQPYHHQHHHQPPVPNGAYNPFEVQPALKQGTPSGSNLGINAPPAAGIGAGMGANSLDIFETKPAARPAPVASASSVPFPDPFAPVSAPVSAPAAASDTDLFGGVDPFASTSNSTPSRPAPINVRDNGGEQSAMDSLRSAYGLESPNEEEEEEAEAEERVPARGSRGEGGVGGFGVMTGGSPHACVQTVLKEGNISARYDTL